MVLRHNDEVIIRGGIDRRYPFLRDGMCKIQRVRGGPAPTRN